jgi:hypothetical protein
MRSLPHRLAFTPRICSSSEPSTLPVLGFTRCA